MAGARPRKPASWGPCPASRSELPDRPVMWAPNASCVSSVQFSNSCIKKVKKQRVKLIFKNTFQLTLCIQTTILTCNRYLTSRSYFTSSCCYRAEGGWFTINSYRKDSAFLSLEVPSPHAHLLGSKCPPPEETLLSMPETGEKERNCLFKSYTNLE